ncbi:MAG: cyanophycinase [Flavobacterium sp.]|nr:MAG: cyanophycinase [Flavobacterium sp.]
MKKSFLIMLLASGISFASCGKSTDKPTPDVSNPPIVVNPTVIRPGSIGIVGDSSNVVKPTSSGLVLMGGGADVEAAFKWMISKSGGGDVVILRASGTDAYNPFVNGLGTVNSVETLLINSKELANNDIVAYIIRNAEMVFIAGGDQSNYMNFWRGTKVEQALNYLLTEKKAPVGGTSAGCAILGSMYYSGENGSTTSAVALENPFDETIKLYNNDFLKAPFLQNVITDQHYLAREREGRSMVFLGRILKDWNIAAKAIAVDERTAVCIDETGKTKVFGDYSATRPYSNAYFLATDLTKKPETLLANTKVNWNQAEKAVNVYEITASETGGGNFNVANFSFTEATGGKAFWWSINNGVLVKKEK